VTDCSGSPEKHSGGGRSVIGSNLEPEVESTNRDHCGDKEAASRQDSRSELPERARIIHRFCWWRGAGQEKLLISEILRILPLPDPFLDVIAMLSN